MKNKKTLILLKLSGAALKGDEKDLIFSSQKINEIIKQIIKLHKTHNVAIVVGGGNIWRGAIAIQNKMRRVPADYMGMLATIINSIALKEVFLANGSDATIYSMLPCEKVVKNYNINDVEKSIANNEIIIFAGGTGQPYFTTDTGAAIKAIEINASIICMGKDGVCGVYSDDPKKNSKATHYSSLKYDDILKKNLKVIDLTALTLCKENDIETIVFNINEKDGIIKALNGKTKITKITR